MCLGLYVSVCFWTIVLVGQTPATTWKSIAEFSCIKWLIRIPICKRWHFHFKTGLVNIYVWLGASYDENLRLIDKQFLPLQEIKFVPRWANVIGMNSLLWLGIFLSWRNFVKERNKYSGRAEKNI